MVNWIPEHECEREWFDLGWVIVSTLIDYNLPWDIALK